MRTFVLGQLKIWPGTGNTSRRSFSFHIMIPARLDQCDPLCQQANIQVGQLDVGAWQGSGRLSGKLQLACCVFKKEVRVLHQQCSYLDTFRACGLGHLSATCSRNRVVSLAPRTSSLGPKMEEGPWALEAWPKGPGPIRLEFLATWLE